MPGGAPLRCGRIGDLLTPAARVGPAFRRASGCGRGGGEARRRGPRVALRAGGDGAGEEAAAADGSAGGSLFDGNPQFSSVFKSVLARQGKSDSDSDGDSEAGSDGRPASPKPEPERKQSAVEEVLQAALAQSNSNLRRLDELRKQLEAATQAEEVQYDRIEFALQRTTMDAAYIATLNELRLDDQQKLFDFELEIQRLLEELHGPGQAPPASFEQPVSYAGDGSVQPGLGGWGPPDHPPAEEQEQPSYSWDGQQEQEEEERQEGEARSFSWDSQQQQQEEEQQPEEQPGYSWDSQEQEQEREEEQPERSWGSREAGEPVHAHDRREAGQDGGSGSGSGSGRRFSWDEPSEAQEPEHGTEPQPASLPAQQQAARTFAWDEPDGGGDGEGWRRESSPQREREQPQPQQQQRQQQQAAAAAAHAGGATYSWRGQPAAEPQYSWRATGDKPSQPGFRWEADDEESDGEGYGSSTEGYDI